MTTTTRRAVALASAFSLALGAAACSQSEPTATPSKSVSSSAAPSSTPPTTTTPATPKPDQILAKAKANALDAKSGAFEGEVDDSGSPMRIAFKGTTDGKTADVEVEQAKAGKVHLIAVGDAVYIRADAKFWKAQGAPASVQQASNKFVKAPASAAGVAGDLSLKSFLKQAFSSLDSSEIDGRVGSETIDGTDCWVLTDKSGKANGAFYVSKDKLELVRFTGTKETPGQLDFSQWNEDLGITAPPPDQVIDLG